MKFGRPINKCIYIWHVCRLYNMICAVYQRIPIGKRIKLNFVSPLVYIRTFFDVINEILNSFLFYFVIKFSILPIFQIDKSVYDDFQMPKWYPYDAPERWETRGIIKFLIYSKTFTLNRKQLRTFPITRMKC